MSTSYGEIFADPGFKIEVEREIGLIATGSVVK